MKNKLFKKAIIATSVALPMLFTTVSVQSDSISDKLFDRYSANSPGVRSTNKGRVFYGGSFDARINVSPTELVGFQAPSISAGCGGIDIFAGSFSLVSKDEIVQMLRGVAQGVPAYFFNLALSNVCADCADLASELEKRVSEFNKWGRTSCETAGAMLNESLPESMRINAKAKSQGATRASNDGLFGGPFEWLNNQIPTPDSVLQDMKDSTGLPKETLEKITNERNRLGILIDDIQNFDYPYIDGSTLPERRKNLLLLFTALAGNPTVNNVNDQLKEEVDGKTLTVTQLFEGENKISTLDYYVCSGVAGAVELNDLCSSYTKVSYGAGAPGFRQAIGFAQTIEDLVFSEKVGNEGIIQRIYKKVSLSAKQEQLKAVTSYNFIPVAMAYGQNPALYTVMKEEISTNVKNAMVRDFQTKTNILLNALYGKAKQRGKPFEEVITNVQTVLEKDIKNYIDTLKSQRENSKSSTANLVAEKTSA